MFRIALQARIDCFGVTVLRKDALRLSQSPFIHDVNLTMNATARYVDCCKRPAARFAADGHKLNSY